MFRFAAFSIMSLLVLSSCEEEASITAPGIDRVLRGHLGVRSMSGRIEVPKDQPIYVLTIFEILDGKILRCGPMSQGSRERLVNGQLEIQVLWDKKERGSKVTFSGGGGISYHESPFWSNVGNSISSGFVADGPDGFKIVAMAQSNVGQDGKVSDTYNTDFESALKTRKHIGVAAVKFFESKELASKYMDFILLNSENLKALY